MPTPVGLQFDLSLWRKGVRDAATIVKKGIHERLLTPFERGLRRVGGGIKNVLGAPIKAIGGMLSTAFGPLLAVGAVLVGARMVGRALWDAAQAADAYADSTSRLRAALATVGDGASVRKASAEVEELGKRLQLALGIGKAETNDTFANFVTRGFNPAQARQLTILAANYAKKAGKPLEEVAGAIADAANGNLKGIKALGVQVAVTGDKTTDARNAVEALKASYGSLGAELTDPQERLAAAMNELAVGLGERLLPLFEPLINFTTDFVNGLLHTEEGQKILDGIAETVQTILLFLQGLITGISNVIEMAKAGAKVITALVKAMIAEAMREFFTVLEAFPAGKFLMEKLGLGPEMAAGFKEQVQEQAKALQDASSQFMAAQGEFLRGEGDTGIAGTVAGLAAQGKAMREKATADLGAEIAGTSGDTFAGRVATDATARKAAAAGAKENAAAEREVARRATAYGSADEGQRVSVRIVSTRPDRFRRARV